ncbi:MAG: hypothetical protein ACREPR_21775 [Brasilonema sp.]
MKIKSRRMPWDEDFTKLEIDNFVIRFSARPIKTWRRVEFFVLGRGKRLNQQELRLFAVQTPWLTLDIAISSK